MRPHPDLLRVTRAAEVMKQHVQRRLDTAARRRFWANLTGARDGPGNGEPVGWLARLGRMFRRDAF